MRLVHLMSGLEVGGREGVVLDLARRARARRWDHALLLFDTPFRDGERDLDPGDVPWELLPRGAGLDLGFVGRLARRLRGVDVVHAHNDTAIAYAGLARLVSSARLASAGRPPALAATFHNRPSHDTPAARRVTRWATRRAAAVSAVSSDLADELVGRGWSRPCEVIGNGVDLERFADTGPVNGPDGRAWRQRWGVAPGELVVGHVGRFVPGKRQGDLLEAVRLLAARGPAPHLVLVGDGPERARFAGAAARRVHLVERAHDVAALLRALDVFVLCSAHEAAPLALLEALACGRPCVATAVGGVPHMLGGAGRLVPPADPGALAAALGELLADPEERARLGRAARLRAAELSAARAWERYVELWSRIIPRTSGGSAGVS